MLDLTGKRALTFDCYGTLVDWNAGLGAWLESFVRRHGRSAARDLLLGLYARFETGEQQAAPELPYREILARTGGRVAAELGLPWSAAVGRAFAASLPHWPVFPDTIEALRVLKRRYLLVVVSNVDQVSFTGTQRTLDVPFDAVVTAEAVGAYKPDRRMFERALEVLAAQGVEKSQILHVAESLYHDIAPARALGIESVHVLRSGGGASAATGGATVRPDLAVADLAELARLVEAAFGAAATPR